MECLRVISSYSVDNEGKYKHAVTFLTGNENKSYLDILRETTKSYAKQVAGRGQKITDVRVTNKHGACSCITLWNMVIDDSGCLACDGEGFTSVQMRRNYSISDLEVHMPFKLLGVGSFRLKSEDKVKSIQGLIISQEEANEEEGKEKIQFIKLCENNAHIHNLIENVEKVLPDASNIFELFTKYIKIDNGTVSIIDA
nr:22kDa-protein [Grapevine leafroll-associated virus 13]